MSSLLHGYGALVLEGALQTVQLAVCSLALAFAIGLLGACAKLFGSRWIAKLARLYTTIVRGAPDLVLMLLLYYSIQILLNGITERLHWTQIDIKPFAAGVIVLGLIHGAYFTETLRGAFLAIPRGQLESGTSLGMSFGHVLAHILFPQMMRYALPALGNNWQVIVKSTALVSIIGLSDVVKAAQDAGKTTTHYFFFIGVAAFVYLLVTTASNLVLRHLENRYDVGVRKVNV
ncbi:MULTISPECIES: ABC transporter permease [unclassified Caballeronia]|uniref:ABC transporter permease n=1 Tax=unclassified Caballeronia TaxID=2646786 RepID=UPI002028FDB4|nr:MULTISPECIES: ABC transporter permease [unclassified Caballeronia]